MTTARACGAKRELLAPHLPDLSQPSVIPALKAAGGGSRPAVLEWANPQKTVLFLLGVCYRTEEVPSFLRHREYVHCIAYTSQCAFCYCCAYQPSPSNDCTQQSLLSNDCAQQHMLCIDMLLVPLPLPSLALHTTCAATTARANTCFALTYCL